jgi:hypothetical protein
MNNTARDVFIVGLRNAHAMEVQPGAPPPITREATSGKTQAMAAWIDANVAKVTQAYLARDQRSAA